MAHKLRLVLTPLLLAIAGGSAAAPSPADCAGVALHGRSAEAQTCFQSLARSADPYLRAEGDWGLKHYEDANREFRLAVAHDDRNAMVRVRWGRLLHERFNDTDAAALFHEALERDANYAPAYLGLAVLSVAGFDDRAAADVHKALALDSRLVEAHDLLAAMALEDDEPQQAIAEADIALKLDPDALDAMALEAAALLLTDRSPESWLQKINGINPGYGKAYASMAHHLALNRRYEEAGAYYRQAIERDPELWPARSELAINLMRLGRMTEAQQQLVRCYDAGYRDAATVNSLRLLDTYKSFVAIEDAHAVFRFAKAEAELLPLYFEPLVRSALATYESKYQEKLAERVAVEVYPNHEDFAVRTVGLPGLGALGVTFGTVVAMDSPSGRPPGSFNWSSTLWHEMNHVFILTATHNRVPRWFAEGLAVHEQGQAKREWAEHLTPVVVSALAQKKLLPLEQLDGGFVRPSYPDQILVSYYQAGRICDYIQERWGADSLLQLVHYYAQPDTSTVAALRSVLNMDAKDFDAQFQAWVYRDVGDVVTHFDEWRRRLQGLGQLVKDRRTDEALKEAAAVQRLYPQYVEEANAYAVLADIHLARGDHTSALAVLSDYRRFGGEDPALLKQLATLQEQAGEARQAAATLDAINEIYPVNDENLHARLAALWLELHDAPGAIREYTALVALHPLDRAGALYHLAEAYFAAHDTQLAEENVLAALEAVPGYRPAQQLLLKIEDGNPHTP